VFINARNLSLTWAKLVEFIPTHTIPLLSILILSSYLHLCLPSGLFPSVFPTQTQYAVIPLHSIYYAHLILLHSLTVIIFGEDHTLWSSLLFSFIEHSVISPLFVPHILLSALFSNTPSLCSSL
jgi:hypothetical protein